MLAGHSAGKRNLVEDASWYLLNTYMLLRSLFKATFMYTDPFLVVSLLDVSTSVRTWRGDTKYEIAPSLHM
jgi:hypothetical protein